MEKYIAVEIDPTVQVVAQHANPATKHCPSITHWAHDAMSITEHKIRNLGRIDIMGAGPPCQDFSKARLMNPTEKGGRSGTAGPTGQLFTVLIKIWKMVMKYNPHCQWIIENVDITDMDDYYVISHALQTGAVSINSINHSYTWRNRLFWTNIKLLSNWRDDHPPLDANNCLDSGRTIVPPVTTITANWQGDSQQPFQFTSRPIQVWDRTDSKLRYLRPHEAEKLMGMKPRCTAAPGVSARARLTIIGNAWDINVSTMLLAHSRVATSAVKNLAMEAETYKYATKLHLSNQSRTRESIVDSGSSRHIDAATLVTDTSDTYHVSGFDGSEAWTQGSGHLALALIDDPTKQQFKVIIDDADKFDSARPILPMGKLLREGYEFTFKNHGQICHMHTSNKKRLVKLLLGDDGIITLPHSLLETTKNKQSVCLIQ